jgi:Cysteine-rich domain
MSASRRQILFSGCASMHDRRPVRNAMLELASELRVDLQESPISVCCGARAAHDETVPDASHMLMPLLASAWDGQSIVCLSSACRCALRTRLLDLALNQEATLPDILRHPLTIVDSVELLASVGIGAASLQGASKRSGTQRVALHGVCHADHNPARWPSGKQLTIAFPQGGTLTYALKDTEAPDAALAGLVAATGVDVLDDVSVAQKCADVAIPDRHGGSSCLASVAALEANILVTPCVLCYGALTRMQQGLASGDRARRVRVLHLTQFLANA